jgi:hypothetical protein
MTFIGPKPKRVDLYVTQGLAWSRLLRILDVNGAYMDLTGHAFAGKIRKQYTSVVAYDFVFTPVDTTNWKWALPAATSLTIPVGCNDTDPASKYVYDIVWTPPAQDPVLIIKGILTLNPKST